MSDRDDKAHNIVRFPLRHRVRNSQDRVDEALIRYVSVQMQSSSVTQTISMAHGQYNSFYVEAEQEAQFSKIFGISLCRRGRAALLNLMGVYELSISDVQRFVSVGFIRWRGTEMQFSGCYFTLMYGISTCLAHIYFLFITVFFIAIKGQIELISLLCLLSAMMFSSALCAWSYIMLLHPFWDLWKIRAATRRSADLRI